MFSGPFARDLSFAGLVGLPGGLKWRLLGLAGLPEEGVEGVVGRLILIAEAGREGGPIEPLLFTVLDLLLVGDGAGEICVNVSIVLSDSDIRGWRFLGKPSLTTLSVGAIGAFSLPSSIIANSDLALGGVVSRLPISSFGEAELVGDIRPENLLAHPNDGLIVMLLLSPKGRTSGFFEFDVVI